MGRPLGKRSSTEAGIIVQTVRGALAARGRWLIVFDNAVGPEAVRSYFPAGGRGHLLVTSRSPAFGGVAHPLKVEKMNAEEAVEFLLIFERTLGEDRSKTHSVRASLVALG